MSGGVARGGWRECVCWGRKLGEERTLLAFPSRAWGERFLVFSRISFRVGRIEAALMSRFSLSDFCVLPYFSFLEWYSVGWVVVRLVDDCYQWGVARKEKGD